MAPRGINFKGVTVDLFPQQMSELLAGPRGPVYRAMIVNAEAVRQEAKRLVGVSKPRPGGLRRDSGGRFLAGQRKPGTLRDSIVKRPVTLRGDVAFIVGSNDPIALIHHEGTKPHVIRARRAPMLVFYWDKVGRVVHFKHVNHPGTKPNRYLLKALKVIRVR